MESASANTSLASSAIRQMLAHQPLTPGKVVFAWRVIAGPGLSRAAAASWSEDGTLLLRARSATWKRELERSAPFVRERLAELVGRGVVKFIQVIEDPHA